MAVKLNNKAYQHALKLVKQGKYVVDNKWNPPSADKENRYIEQNGYEKYALWYLGEDTEADKETKGRYKFPYSSDFDKVSRKGIIAVKQRAAQQEYDDIMNAADKILQTIDEKESEEKKQSEHVFVSFAEEEGLNKDVLILITGKFYHVLYGEFELTEESFQQAIKNFNKMGEIPIDINHSIDYPEPKMAEAKGWIKKLYNKEIDEAIMEEYDIRDSRVKGRIGLFGKVEWLDEAKELIAEGKFKFLSAGFVLNDKDKLTGKDIGLRIQHVSLTNVPFLKGLIGKVRLSTLDKNTIYLKEQENKGGVKMEKLLKLLDAQNEEELEQKIEAVLKERDELKELKEELEKQLKEKSNTEEEKVKLEERVKNLETELKINKLLSEGKILAGDVEYVKKLMQYDESLVDEFVKKREVATTQFSGTGENKVAGETREEITILAENWAKEKGLNLSGWEALKVYFREHPEMEEKYFEYTE